MGARKTLSIGVTVNLEHYENLRLEVNGEIESADDADNLVRFLDEILGKFGRGDPATAQQVDSYRKRVFPLAPPPIKVSEIVSSGENVGLADAGSPAGLRPSSLASEAPQAPLPTSDARDMACETCGGDVTPAEQKMSRLFTGKTLCRACMKKV